jgi:hypothetical protein
MRKGLAIEFTERGPVISTNKSVEGISALAQNLVVNVATPLGSDPFFPDRGSDMQKNLLQYGYVSKNFVQHQGNFAAIRYKLFFAKTKYAEDPALQSIIINLDKKADSRAVIRVRAKFGEQPLDTTAQL